MDDIGAKHSDHPLAISAGAKRLPRSQRSALRKPRLMCDIFWTCARALLPIVLRQVQRAQIWCHLNGSFVQNEKTLNVLITKWFISQGLPYTISTSDMFQDVICAAIGGPGFLIFSRDRYGRLLNGQFQLFRSRRSTFGVWMQEACQIKFLNLMHDIWTNCGKTVFFGASMAFIDSREFSQFVFPIPTRARENVWEW